MTSSVRQRHIVEQLEFRIDFFSAEGLLRPYAGLCVQMLLLSVYQVFEFWVDEWKHDCAGSVQNGSALEKSSRFGAPRFRLEVEVDGVQCHSKEVSDEGHGFGIQPG